MKFGYKFLNNKLNTSIDISILDSTFRTAIGIILRGIISIQKKNYQLQDM